MDGPRTWSQREHRIFPDRPTAERVLASIAARLPTIVYVPGAAINLVVTTYLDTPDRHYLTLAEASGGRRSTKLRIREYLASAGIGARFQYHDHCYLERKERVDELRLKQRIQLPKPQIGALLGRRHRLADGGPEACAIAAELDALPLQPVLVTAYERQVFGFEPGLRVTFDQRLAYHFPPEGLYDRARALQPSVLGRPPARGPSRIIEIKHPAAVELPAWLEQLVAGMAREPRFSKFLDGVRALDASEGPVRLTRPISIVRGD